MLHVDPSTAAIAAAPPAFDPIIYLAHMRAQGVEVEARVHHGQKSLSWDIRNARHDDKSEPDPRVDIFDAPDGQQRVFEVLRAEEWIAGARACGLVVAPWREADSKVETLARGGVMMCGQDIDGPDSYGTGTRRFMKHPAFEYAEGLRKGVVFEVLCAQLGIDPDDPLFCAKVNAKVIADREARRMGAAA